MTWKIDDSCDRRVVVTGIGVNTRVGDTIQEFLESLKRGRSGIGEWKHIDTRIALKIGGDMSDFDLNRHLEVAGSGYPGQLVARARQSLRATPLSGRLTAAAAIQAFVDAGLPGSRVAPERVGHVLAGANLNQRYVQENVLTFLQDPEYIDPLYGLMAMDTDVLSVISEILELRGPGYTIGGASGSGNMALLVALDSLRANRADAIVVSGAACVPDSTMLQGWTMLGALSTFSFNDEPWRASRPFDRRREGFVPSEGSAAVVLETLSSAKSRDAHIYAEVLGAAAASDGSRTSEPRVDGQMRAMINALADAYVDPEDIDYINAHAPSTLLGDAIEAQAIQRVFSDHACHIPVNSTKSMVGHCLSAAGVVEFVATVLQMQHKFVHPTINLEEPDPEFQLDLVANEARDCHIEYSLSNSFGFGGLNASVIVGRSPR